MIEDITELAVLAAKLKPYRNYKPIVNDMFEAADDWKNFGQIQFERVPEERWDLTGRMQQEEELLERLRSFYGEAIDRDPDFARIMELGARMIAACKQRKVDPDGWLGIVKVLRRTFGFLASEFGMRPGPGLDGLFDHASDRVSVSLRLPDHFGSSCYVKQTCNPSDEFDLEDLLFMDGVSASLALPAEQEFTTEAEVQAWFTTVADILRRHGSDVLADKPSAFERLAQASAERERLHNEECERLYKLANPGRPVPKPGDRL